MKIIEFLSISIFILLLGLFALFIQPHLQFEFFYQDIQTPITKEQETLVMEFYSQAKSRDIPIPLITYYQYPSNFLTSYFKINQSICSIQNGGFKVYLAPEAGKRTVFHELGHCVLFRGHEYDLFPSGMPSSWMHQSGNSLTESFLNNNEEFYIEELFSKYNTLHLNQEYDFFPLLTLNKKLKMFELGTLSFFELLFYLFIEIICPLILAISFISFIFWMLYIFTISFLAMKNHD